MLPRGLEQTEQRNGPQRARLGTLICALAALVACFPPNAVTTPSPSPPLPPPTAAPSRWTPPSARPLIWFAPLDPYPRPLANGVTLVGSPDFLDLFSATAPWSDAATRVHVFKLYPQFMGTASDVDLVRVVTDLNRRGIAIALEDGPLTASATCGRGVEGFGGLANGLRSVQRIRSAGGTVRYIALDEPYYFGSLYTGLNACRRSAEQVAQEVSSYVRSIRNAAPDIVIGDIEPLTADLASDVYVRWLDAYRSTTGETLPFFHLDLDWSRQDWPAAARSIEAAARQRGIEFGIIYFGNPGDVSDAAWVAHAADRMAVYEGRTGGKPEHVIFQSWHDHPDRVLPETDGTTFTALIDRYFRTRTALTVSSDPAASRSVVGRLTDDAGKGLDAATVDVSVRELDGPGRYAERTLSGTVPVGATQAILGLRVNTECGCSNASDLALYGVSYTDAGGATNRVANADFASGIDRWGLWGSGTTRIEPSDRGDRARMLHVSATSTQFVGLNSASFPVTAGASYTAKFSARVGPTSAGSGYFTVIFLATTETSRVTLRVDPEAVVIGSAVTNASGVFTIADADRLAGKLIVEATYVGSERYWPSYAEQIIP